MSISQFILVVPKDCQYHHKIALVHLNYQLYSEEKCKIYCYYTLSVVLYSSKHLISYPYKKLIRWRRYIRTNTMHTCEKRNEGKG